MIRPCVVGFDVFDDKGNLISHVSSFAEASELYHTTKPDLPQRPLVCESETPNERGPLVLNKATSDARKRVSKALGVMPAEVGVFNKKLDEYGITESRYNSKTGFLESTNDDHHAAAWAIRGHYDQEATSGTAMKLADRMGF